MKLYWENNKIVKIEKQYKDFRLSYEEDKIVILKENILHVNTANLNNLVFCFIKDILILKKRLKL